MGNGKVGIFFTSKDSKATIARISGNLGQIKLVGSGQFSCGLAKCPNG